MRVPRLVLCLSILVFGGIGLAFTLFPGWMASHVEIPLPTPTARIDFSATYGGLELGIAAFMAMCLKRDVWVYPALLLSGFGLAGLGLVRLAGILGAGPVRPILFLLLGAEVFGVILSFWAARAAHAALGDSPAR